MDELTQAFVPPSRIDLARETDFQAGALTIRPSRCEVEAGGVRRSLQRRVMQVLVALARSPNQVVSQHELIVRCWGGLSVSDDAIGRCIGQLRRLAVTWPEPPFEIETIAGVGYRLEATVAWRPALDTSGADGAAPPRRRRVPLLGWVALAALAATASWYALSRSPPPVPSRVAVERLAALSPAQDTRDLADSISDEVLSVLGANQVPAASFTDAAGLNAGDRATRLGVGLIVDGSVRKDADETRVSVRIEDAQSGEPVWSQDFTRPNAAVAGLQDEVAARLVDIIEIAEFARTSQPPLRDDTALSALLAAHSLIREGRRDSWARLLDLAQRPVAIAPGFAFGHSMLATAAASAVSWRGMPPRSAELAALARQEARRALEIDPRDSAAYYALSLMEPIDGAYQEREAILLQGLAQEGRPAPPYAALNESEGYLLRAVGRPKAGLPYFQRSQAIDWLSAPKNVSLILAYAETGQQPLADQLLAQSLRRWPDQGSLRAMRLDVAAFYGSPDAALAMLNDPSTRPVDLSASAIEAWRAYLLTKRHGGSATDAARLIVGADTTDDLGLDIAVVMLASLGLVDQAFEQADREMTAGRFDPGALFTPPAAPMRKDPRFWPLAQRLGLVDYWRATGNWPEFCGEPGLPYDCKAEAAKVSQAPKHGPA